MGQWRYTYGAIATCLLFASLLPVLGMCRRHNGHITVPTAPAQLSSIDRHMSLLLHRHVQPAFRRLPRLNPAMLRWIEGSFQLHEFVSTRRPIRSRGEGEGSLSHLKMLSFAKCHAPDSFAWTGLGAILELFAWVPPEWLLVGGGTRYTLLRIATLYASCGFRTPRHDLPFPA